MSVGEGSDCRNDTDVRGELHGREFTSSSNEKHREVQSIAFIHRRRAAKTSTLDRRRHALGRDSSTCWTFLRGTVVEEQYESSIVLVSLSYAKLPFEEHLIFPFGLLSSRIVHRLLRAMISNHSSLIFRS